MLGYHMLEKGLEFRKQNLTYKKVVLKAGLLYDFYNMRNL